MAALDVDDHKLIMNVMVFIIKNIIIRRKLSLTTAMIPKHDNKMVSKWIVSENNADNSVGKNVLLLVNK